MKASESISSAVFMASEKKMTETIDRERRRLLSFIKKRVPEPEDAEDLVQDVLYQFFQALQLPEPIEQISNWLFRVARNKIIDRHRKKKPESMAQTQSGFAIQDDETPLFLDEIIPDTSQMPDEELINSMMWDALEDALDELPSEQREVFVLHEFEDLSFKQISDRTGVSVNTLLSRKRYTVLHLRNRLEIFYNELLTH